MSILVGDISLENVEITHSVTALSLRSQVSLQLINCRFYNNLYAVNGRDAGLVNISSCVFERNENAVYLHGVELVDVANSFFQSSGVSVDMRGTSSNASVSIVGCSFRRLEGLSYWKVVYVDLHVTHSLHSVSLSGNTFEENYETHCIKVYISAASSYDDFRIVSIVGNSFNNNSGASVIVFHGDSAYSHLQLRRNVFQNPYCPFEIEIQSPWRGDYVIDASENWWGSTNRTYISERISDVFLDSTKAKVSITSIYSDPEMTRLEQLISDLRTWNVVDGKLVGGELDRNVTLASSDVPYFVNKTIYIPKGFQLQLKENVTLHFAQQRGIVIEGTYV